jgi:hypothetical protein
MVDGAEALLLYLATKLLVVAINFACFSIFNKSGMFLPEKYVRIYPKKAKRWQESLLQGLTFDK